MGAFCIRCKDLQEHERPKAFPGAGQKTDLLRISARTVAARLELAFDRAADSVDLASWDIIFRTVLPEEYGRFRERSDLMEIAPTDTEPGTPETEMVLSTRYSLGLPTVHPLDNPGPSQAERQRDGHRKLNEPEPVKRGISIFRGVNPIQSDQRYHGTNPRDPS